MVSQYYQFRLIQKNIWKTSLSKSLFTCSWRIHLSSWREKSCLIITKIRITKEIRIKTKKKGWWWWWRRSLRKES